MCKKKGIFVNFPIFVLEYVINIHDDMFRAEFLACTISHTGD